MGRWTGFCVLYILDLLSSFTGNRVTIMRSACTKGAGVMGAPPCKRSATRFPWPRRRYEPRSRSDTIMNLTTMKQITLCPIGSRLLHVSPRGACARVVPRGVVYGADPRPAALCDCGDAYGLAAGGATPAHRATLDRVGGGTAAGVASAPSVGARK